MEIKISIDDEEAEALPQEVRAALEELAAALGGSRTSEAAREGDEVTGFQFGKPGGLGLGSAGLIPITVDFCISYSDGKGGGDSSCGLFVRPEGKPPPKSCTVNWS